MKDTIFLLVKATISTTHVNMHEAIADLQKNASCQITDTQKVKVEKLVLMDYKLK